MFPDNVLDIRNRPLPLWLVTGLRAKNVKSLLKTWKQEKKSKLHIITAEDLLDNESLQHSGSICYHCVARWIDLEIDDLWNCPSGRQKQIVCEVPPHLNLPALLHHLRKVENEKTFKIRGTLCSLDIKNFFKDLHGKRHFNSSFRPVSEVLIEQVEYSDIIVTNSQKDLGKNEQFIRSLNSKTNLLPQTEFPHFLKENEHNSYFDSKNSGNQVSWKRILNLEDGETDPSGVLFKSSSPFDMDRFIEILERWPKAILRSEGYLWFAERQPLLYDFSQTGQKTFALNPTCGDCLTHLPYEITQSKQTHLALVGLDKVAIESFTKELRLATVKNEGKSVLSFHSKSSMDVLFADQEDIQSMKN